MIGYLAAYASVIAFAVCLGKAAGRPTPKPQVRLVSRTPEDRRPGMSGPGAP